LPLLPASGIKVYQDWIVARAEMGRREEVSVGETGAKGRNRCTEPRAPED
jgi:hypothetical protein